MTPVICIIFTFLIKELASEQLPSGVSYTDNPYPHDFADFTLLDENSLVIDKKTLKPIKNSPSRNNALQWYLYECVDKCPSSTLLGSYDGLTAQATPNGSSLLTSIINDRS